MGRYDSPNEIGQDVEPEPRAREVLQSPSAHAPTRSPPSKVKDTAAAAGVLGLAGIWIFFQIFIFGGIIFLCLSVFRCTTGL